MNCNRCGQAPKKPTSRLPKGWSRVAGETLCRACFDRSYICRAVTLPLLRPADGDWPALRELLRQAWSETSACCNFLVREMYVRDYRRQPSDAKLPAWERPYLYPETSQFNLPSQTRASLEQSVGGKYRAARYELLWTGAASLPSFRFGVPFEAPAQSWRPILEEADDKRELRVSVALPGGRAELQLRASKEFARQVRQFEWLCANPELRGSIAIYRKRINSETGHGNGDGRFPKHRIMVKMVGYFPVAAHREREERTVVVRTDTDSFLFAATDADEEPWLLHADRFRDQCYQHARNLRRVRDDNKPEFRNGKRKPKLFDKGKLKKFHDRQRSFIQMSVAAVVGYARRRRCTKLVYDDSERGYFPMGFPYHEFEKQLNQKCDADGIDYSKRDSSDPVSQTCPDPLAMEKTLDA